MPKSKTSLYFLGTDEFAVAILDRLASDSIFDVLGVVVPPDQPVGRKQVMTPCPVKVYAEEHQIPILYEPDELIGQAVDFLVVASYGRLLRQNILDVPRYASLNVHPSLLPQYRGPSPVQTALLHGDRVTGVCVMGMVSKMDAGPVYSFSELAIRLEHDSDSLRAELAQMGAEVLAQTIPGIAEGSIEPLPQDGDTATCCPKIDRSSGYISWDLDSADLVERKLKAYANWPGISTTYNGKRLKILKGHAIEAPVTHPGGVIRVGDQIGVQSRAGVFILESVQLEGKKPMQIDEFMRGYPAFGEAFLG